MVQNKSEENIIPNQINQKNQSSDNKFKSIIKKNVSLQKK